jgi:hypothetical protein
VVEVEKRFFGAVRILGDDGPSSLAREPDAPPLRDAVLASGLQFSMMMRNALPREEST